MLQVFGDGVFGDSWGTSGPTVLYLHGWRRDHHDATSLADALVTYGIRTVALDLPGFGASPAPDTAGGARRYAQLLTAVRDEISPDLIVGHSFGGRIAACWATEVQVPIILTGAPLLHRQGRATSPLAYRLIRRAARARLVSPARLDAARRKYGSADYNAASGIMRDILVATIAESYEDEISRWLAPVTLWWGGDDHDVPLEVATRAAGLAPHDVRLVTCANAGHLAPVTHGSELATLVREVLA